jgi:DNA polymerase epsilon subunit 1
MNSCILCYTQQISSYFTDKLLGVVRDIVLHMKGMGRSETDQSTSSGLHQLTDDLHRGDAALEFIKHVCAVFALDQSVQHDVHVILVSQFVIALLNNYYLI